MIKPTPHAVIAHVARAHGLDASDLFAYRPEAEPARDMAVWLVARLFPSYNHGKIAVHFHRTVSPITAAMARARARYSEDGAWREQAWVLQAQLKPPPN